MDNNLKNNYEQWHSRLSASDIVSEKKSFDILFDMFKGRDHQRGKLLDVSCGKGMFLALASEKGFKTYGIDISEVAVNIAKQVSSSSILEVGNSEEMPYLDDAFDVVTCLGSLEHFTNLDNGIKEISRVLKPSGNALIMVPNLYFLGHIYMAVRYGSQPSEAGQQFSEQFLTRGGWQNVLENNGLKVEEVFKYNYIWATKKVSKFAIFSWNLLKPFIPVGLSYNFCFLCKKG